MSPRIKSLRSTQVAILAGLAVLWKVMVGLIIAFLAHGALADEPVYGSAPHRFEAAIRVNDIHRYSINLMWINRTLVHEQKFLSSAKSEEELNEKLLRPVIEWAVANPDARVHLWYDSVFATQEAVHATLQALQGQMKKSSVSNVTLSDIRSIGIVAANPDCFSDQLPVYYRIDILKAILLVHAMENEGNDAAIFSDLEVGDLRPGRMRMGKAELFSPAVMDGLRHHGLMLNEVASRIENQFLQMTRDDRMIRAIKVAIVNVNLLRAVTGLNSRDDNFILSLVNAPFKSTLDDVFSYYQGTAPGSSIKVNPGIINQGRSTDPWIDYDPRVHGYAPFGLHFAIRGYIGLEPDPEHRGDWLTMRNMLRFPTHVHLNGWDFGHARKVDVRQGNGHGWLETEVVPRTPADGGTPFRCLLWE